MHLFKNRNHGMDRTVPKGTFPAIVLEANQFVSHWGNSALTLQLGVNTPQGGVTASYYIHADDENRIEGMLLALAPESFKSWEQTGSVRISLEDLIWRRCKARIKDGSLTATLVDQLWPAGDPGAPGNTPEARPTVSSNRRSAPPVKK